MGITMNTSDLADTLAASGGITKTDGLTFRVREILERAKATVAAGVRKL